jgi:hypothetical protein
LYPHVLASLGDEALRGQDVLDLARADAEGKGAEGAVGGGVAVAADDGGAGEGEALLGADDMDDALSLVTEAEVGDAEFLDVVLEGDTLRAGVVFLDEAGNVFECLSRRGGDVL